MTEVWKQIPEYEGFYEASNLGNIRALKRVVKRKDSLYTIGTSHILKPYKNSKGYLCVDLYKNGIRTKYKVHRLIATTFIPNPQNKPYIDHINTNKEDNSVTNLRWVTSKENKNNPLTRKLHSDIQSRKDIIEKCFRARERNHSKTRRIPVAQMDKNGITIKVYPSIGDAEKDNRISKGHISEVLKGKRKYAGGFLWKILS